MWWWMEEVKEDRRIGRCVVLVVVVEMVVGLWLVMVGFGQGKREG